MIAGSFLDNSRGPSYESFMAAFQTGPQVMANIFALSSLASIFSGFFAPRWKNHLMGATRLFLLAQTFAAVGIASAAFLPGSLLILFTCIFIFGFVNISLVISCTLIITRTVPPALSLKAYTGYHALYGLASCAAPAVFAWGLHHHWPWQYVFWVAAALNLFVLLKSFCLGALPPPTQEEQQTAPRMHWHQAAVFFGLMLAFYVAAETTITTRLVYYLKQGLAFPVALANHYLSAFFIALLAGRLLFALVDFKLRPAKILLISISSSLGLIFLGLLVHPGFLALAAFTLGIFYPATAILIKERFPQTFANVFATVMFIIYVLSAGFHWVVGILTERISINAAMWTVPTFAILCGLCLAKLYRPKVCCQD